METLLLASRLDERLEVAAENLLRAAAHLGLSRDETVDESDGGGGVRARLGEDAEREGVVLLEERLAQVFGLDDLLLRVGGDLGSQYDRLPRALRELVLGDLLLALRAHRDGATSRSRGGDASRPRDPRKPSGARATRERGRGRASVRRANAARHHRRRACR